MSQINLSCKEFLQKYKGKVIGFTRGGFAEIPSDGGFSLQAVTFCKCCRSAISSVSVGADFCPICAYLLGIVDKETAIELSEPQWKDAFDSLETEEKYNIRMECLVEGFKRGISYGVDNCVKQMDWGKIK